MADEFCPHCMSSIGYWLDDPILTENGAKYAWKENPDDDNKLALFEVKRLKDRAYTGVTNVKREHIIELQDYYNEWEVFLDLTPTDWKDLPALTSELTDFSTKYITELRTARAAILTALAAKLGSGVITGQFKCNANGMYKKKYSWNSSTEAYYLTDQTSYRSSPSAAAKTNADFRDIEDLRHPIPYAKFEVTVPETTDNGVWYSITVRCLNKEGNTITDFNGTAGIRNSTYSGILPSQLVAQSSGNSTITFVNGIFTGNIRKVAQTFSGPTGNLVNSTNGYYNVCVSTTTTDYFPFTVRGFSTTFGYGYNTDNSATSVYDVLSIYSNHIQPPDTATTGQWKYKQWKYNWATFPSYEEHTVTFQSLSNNVYRHDGSAVRGSGDLDENINVIVGGIKASDWVNLNTTYSSLIIKAGAYGVVGTGSVGNYICTYNSTVATNMYFVSSFASLSTTNTDLGVASNCTVNDPEGGAAIQMPTKTGVYSYNRTLTGNITTTIPPFKDD